MGNCITSTAYTMQADIYSASVSQDPNSGIVNKTWTYQKTINCYARSILRKGVGRNSTAIEIEEYLDVIGSMIKLRSNEPIPYNVRLVKVRNSDGVIYLENQYQSSQGGFEGSTIFEPRGSTPLVNFDGSVIEYETVLMRQEIQRLD